MPAPEFVTSSAQPVVKATSQKPHPEKPQSRKKRAARRRGRARNGIESDEEIEREAASSGSDDDEDQSSSSQSATDDSDTEPGSDDVPANIQAPSTSKGVDAEGVPHINGATAPFFTPSLAWSEMVADENENGAAGLPVIEFSAFNGATTAPARPPKKSQRQKQKKAEKAAAAAPPTKQPEPDLEESPAESEPPKGSASPPPPRKLGQTARQAYQERLEKDPSYVPKVGGFWGHDDRLMDKDLRSLSGWWRGQWQGRGRGRGFGRRGGAHGGHDSHPIEGVDPVDLPPVERNWTHDGFEEMKRREEERQPQQDVPASRGRGGFRGGRGGFAGRGRGSFKPHFDPSSASPSTPRVPFPGPHRGRVWFSMKPEQAWSQHSSAFLFYESSIKGGPHYRVKIPGKQASYTKATRWAQNRTVVPVDSPCLQTPETRDLHYVVRLPARTQEQSKAPKPKAPGDDVARTLSAITEVEPTPTPTPATMTSTPPVPEEEDDEEIHSSQPSPAVISQLEQLSIEPAFSDPDRQAKTEEAVLRNPTHDNRLEGQEDSTSSEPRPALPPLQTVFTPPPPPVSQPSPVYGSPYTYPQALPPGIGFNHQGIPYELATGRPVYLQTAPPPPPMYNPRPIMHSHHPPPGLSYGHVAHPSAMSPDFLSQPSHTPPMNGFIDPATGAPIFSFPRASARLEIRAPDDPLRSPPNNSKAAPANHGPSKLRTTAMAFEPARAADGGQYYPSVNTPENGPTSYEAVNGVIPDESGQHPSMGSMMSYNPYQQPYFYPEAYGYPPYMDLSQQTGPYEGYNVDQGQQQAVYY